MFFFPNLRHWIFLNKKNKLLFIKYIFDIFIIDEWIQFIKKKSLNIIKNIFQAWKKFKKIFPSFKMNSSTGSTVNFASLVGQLDLSLKSIDFNFFMIMIIFPIGIILNGLQLYVFSKKELNLKTNMGSMHALLSFFNILAIIFSILLTQLLPFLGINIKTYTSLGCKLLSFIQRVS